MVMHGTLCSYLCHCCSVEEAGQQPSSAAKEWLSVKDHPGSCWYHWDAIECRGTGHQVDIRLQAKAMAQQEILR